MATPQLIAQAERTISEADLRILALAKVQATKAYNALLYINVAYLTDEQAVDREIELAAARKAMFDASSAFDRAV